MREKIEKVHGDEKRETKFQNHEKEYKSLK
jgi:hypothetical protein